MRSRYTWLDLVELDAGLLPLVDTPHGDAARLDVGDLAVLPTALRDSLQAEGFDLERGIVVSHDRQVIDEFVFKQ